MSIYFSSETNGFYDTNINIDIPPDAVEISESLYIELLLGQSKGGVISSENGCPVLVL